MSIDKMGLMNVPWGICGFTSSLYALYAHSPKPTFWQWLTGTGARAKLGAGGESPTKILAEIKTYLRMLQADGKQDILDSIETFTQSFEDFDTWTIENYIERVSAVVTNGADQADPNFGIGMPPSAVIDYMKRVCRFSNAREIKISSSAPEMILGMGTSKLGMTMYGGLGHYVYSLNNKIYSWGQQFANPLTAMDGVAGVAKNDWKIVCKITL